ncbi:MAG: ABC transporter ATP-binding protein [Erysipelotrichales bacterium]|nr:MAG: ABC transporter ATP-binding protein [Erysipelotrichales bacterium]
MIKKFIAYYRPYKVLLFIDILAAILIASLDLVTPRFSNYLISSILTQGNMQLLLFWCGIIFAVFTARVLLQYVVEYWGHVLGVQMEYDRRKEMFKHIQTLPISYFDNMKVGKLMSRLVNDLNEISEVAHHGPEDLLISAVLLVGSFIMMFMTNVTLAIAMAILVPLMIVFGVRQNLKFRRAFRVMREKLSEINAQAQDNFSGIRVVKAFNAEEKEELSFAIGNENFATSRRGALKVMAEFGVTVKGFISLIQLTVFLLGGYLVFQGQLTIGGLVEFILYVQLFQQPINRISGFIMQYNAAMAGFERFLGVLDIAPQTDRPNAVEIPKISGSVRFEDVSFEYGDRNGQHVLSHISFNVEPGSKIAFVGPSGSGKTTLCSLIPRFYELENGSIKIDGTDVRDIQLKNLREHVGIVQQDVFIFAGTIAQNIEYGKPGATREEVIAAAKMAKAWEFIQQIPDGMDTYIGEHGVKLSGGQKQRVSLARIFLKNPKILLLDEATSALDNETEKLIQETLDELAKERTTFVIAHRLSTITDADEIFVLTREGIIERGNHHQLLQKKGFYHRLYHAQDTE